MSAVYGQVGFYFKKSWRLTFKYYLSSDYTFEEKTLGAKEFILTKPVSSFGINLTLDGRLALDINAFTYSEYSLDGTQSEFKESAS